MAITVRSDTKTAYDTTHSVNWTYDQRPDRVGPPDLTPAVPLRLMNQYMIEPNFVGRR